MEKEKHDGKDIKSHIKTAYIPNLQGQPNLWKNNVRYIANQTEYVVQLGNLISCGEKIKDTDPKDKTTTYKINGPNFSVLKYIKLYGFENRKNWKQLVGKNEIMALNFPDEWTEARSRNMLRSFWFDDDPFFKTAVVHNNRLITHGGLTYGEWVNLGRPTNPHEAAHKINEKYSKKLYFGESWVLGNKPNFAADPVFTDPIMELYPSWLTTTEKLPFNQIHGSTSLNNPIGRSLITDENSPISYIDQISFRKYGSIVKINDKEIIGLALNIPDWKINRIAENESIFVEAEITDENKQIKFIDQTKENKQITKKQIIEQENKTRTIENIDIKERKKPLKTHTKNLKTKPAPIQQKTTKTSDTHQPTLKTTQPQNKAKQQPQKPNQQTKKQPTQRQKINFAKPQETTTPNKKPEPENIFKNKKPFNFPK